MGDILAATSWLATVVAAVLAFALGAVWYSWLFQKQWLKGVTVPREGASGGPAAMIVQFAGTFLYAWVIGILQFQHALPLAIIVSVMVAALVAASGLFGQKGMSSVVVEVGYIAAMATVVMIVHHFL